MPQYRYGDPAKGGKWVRRLNVFYFFIAWNAFALTGYLWWKSRKEPKETEHMTPLQKYLYYLNIKGDNIRVVKYSGLTKVDSQTMTKEEILAVGKGQEAAEEQSETS